MLVNSIAPGAYYTILHVMAMSYEIKNIFIISLESIRKYNICYIENYMDKDNYTYNTGLFKIKYKISMITVKRV